MLLKILVIKLLKRFLKRKKENKNKKFEDQHKVLLYNKILNISMTECFVQILNRCNENQTIFLLIWFL